VPDPDRGSVWLADLGTPIGHQQTGRRPVLIRSVNAYNRGPSTLVVVAPLTSTLRDLPVHVLVSPLSVQSNILCDHLRSISRDRLIREWGPITARTMRAVEENLAALLGL
jgi:mRNA interferase MazF